MTDQVESQATPFSEGVTTVADPQPVATTPEPITPVEPVFQVPDAAKDLIGDGKKYSTAEDALNALPHAQNHILKLEDEMASLREKIAKTEAVEDVLQEINKTPPAQVAEPQLTPEQLDALIDNRLATKEVESVKATNQSQVVDKFIQMYGDKDKAEAAYLQKAQDLGLTVEHVNSLASTSPKAVFELFGFKPEQTIATRITPSINSEAVINNAPEQTQAKSVMGVSTHKDDIAAWNAAGANL